MQRGQWGLLLVIMTVFGSLCSYVHGQTAGQDQGSEQTGFNSDEVPGEVYVKKPVQISDRALEVLIDTLSPGTINCIQSTNALTPEQIPGSWFVGSEIHLDGPDEVDLIVLPARMAGESPSPNRCLGAAHGGPFWILRHINGRYELLLETYADGLSVLESRTNLYRDIETWSTTAVSTTSLRYKMDVAQYQLSEKKSKP
jgi:hypothetical protein